MIAPLKKLKTYPSKK
jgi:hypothetical protein